jgi:membrane protein YqaA with SNARE-associated domain
MKYSLKKGTMKVAISVLTVVVAFVVPMFPEFFNLSIIDMLEKTMPILRTATIAGLITGLLNYLKIKYAK